MIRKPSSDWRQFDDGAAVRTVQATAAFAKDAHGVALRGVHVVRGVICFFFAALWGFAALMSGLSGSLPSLVGIGAMAALMVWLGRRAFAKARAA